MVQLPFSGVIIVFRVLFYLYLSFFTVMSIISYSEMLLFLKCV